MGNGTSKLIRWLLLITIWVCLSLPQFSESNIIPVPFPERGNMIIHADMEKNYPNVNYSHWHLYWDKDITQIKPKQENVRMCATGTWLVYRRGVLVVNNVTDTYLHTTKSKKLCNPIAELPHKVIKSAQYLTDYGVIGKDTIKKFPNPKWSGFGTTMTHPGSPQSITTVGKKKWTLDMWDRDNLLAYKICIAPPQDHPGIPVCLMSHFSDGLHYPKMEVLTTKAGCREDKIPPENVVAMEICYDINEGLVYPIPLSWPKNKPIPEGGPIPTTNDTAPGVVGCLPDVNSALTPDQVELIYHRLLGLSSPTMDAEELFEAHMHLPGNLVWTVEFFFKCVRILQKVCDHPVVDPEYLEMFASVYLWHFGNAIELNPTIGNSIDPENYREMMHDMDRCYATVVGTNFDSIVNTIETHFREYEKIDPLLEVVAKDLTLRQSLDHVMEINWFMLNAVASICYKSLSHDLNFLPRFTNMFHTLYLSPIENQWVDPGNITVLYKFLFGGYGMQKTLAKLGFCTLNSIEYAELVGVYPRPFDQSEQILIPKDFEQAQDFQVIEVAPVL